MTSIAFQEQLRDIGAMKTLWAHLLSFDQFEELKNYFGVTLEMSRIVMGDRSGSQTAKMETKIRKMECLLTVLGEKRYPDPWNSLKTALPTVGKEMCFPNSTGPCKAYM